jgi:hypothetical protein
MTAPRIRGILRAAPLLLTALVAAGAASAAGPGWSTAQSLVSPGGRLAYEARASRGRTTLSLLRHGERARVVKLRGVYGFPVPTNEGTAEGLSRDRRTLVLAHAGGFPRFAVLEARTLRLHRTIKLRGVYTYDALSPDANTLYLIQHVQTTSDDRYFVRAFDLAAGRLVKHIIADAREKGPMTGWAISRATGPSGRWVYTLYSRARERPFVHALDTVDRHAVCIDLPWRWSQSVLTGARLRVQGRTLVVARLHGGESLLAIDLRTFRVRT